MTTHTTSSSSSSTSGHESRDKLWQIIQELEIAMLTTIAEEGQLRSRPMSTQQIDADHAELWFFISIDSPTVVEIYHEREIGLSYASPETHRYVSVSGRAFVVRDQAKANQLWTPAARIWFPQGVNDPHLALLRVEVTAAQFWDSPSAKVVHLGGLVDLRIKGHAERKAKLGEGMKVKMR